MTARAAELRELALGLRVHAIGAAPGRLMRLAALELDQIADALDQGGGIANGFVAVPLLHDGAEPAPFPPPPLGAAGGRSPAPAKAAATA